MVYRASNDEILYHLLKLYKPYIIMPATSMNVYFGINMPRSNVGEWCGQEYQDDLGSLNEDLSPFGLAADECNHTEEPTQIVIGKFLGKIDLYNNGAPMNELHTLLKTTDEKEVEDKILDFLRVAKIFMLILEPTLYFVPNCCGCCS